MNGNSKKYIKMFFSIRSNETLHSYEELDNIWYNLTKNEFIEVEECIKFTYSFPNKDIDELIEKFEKLQVLK